MPRSDILIAVDGSAESDAAIRWATREALLLGAATVTLVHVVAPVVVSWPVANLRSDFCDWQEENAQQVLERAQKLVQAEMGDAHPPKVTELVLHGNVAPTLVRLSTEAGLVVVGSRGLGGVAGAVLGSTSRSLLHHAHCPVTVIHRDEAHAVDANSPVLVGIDGSPVSEAATARAFDEASRRRVDVVALHAWSDVRMPSALGVGWHEYEDQGHEVLGERLAGWQERYPDVGVRRRIVCDRPAHWLIDESQRAQLVVLGSRGRGGFAGMLLGSVSTTVAGMAKCPVMVVRQ